MVAGAGGARIEWWTVRCQIPPEGPPCWWLVVLFWVFVQRICVAVAKIASGYTREADQCVFDAFIISIVTRHPRCWPVCIWRCRQPP